MAKTDSLREKWKRERPGLILSKEHTLIGISI